MMTSRVECTDQTRCAQLSARALRVWKRTETALYRGRRSGAALVGWKRSGPTLRRRVATLLLLVISAVLCVLLVVDARSSHLGRSSGSSRSWIAVFNTNEMVPEETIIDGSATSAKQGFAERRDAMRGECATRTNLSSLSHANLAQLMYNDKHKIIFCGIPKVGVTNWMKVFITLSGRANVSQPDQIDGNKMHRTQRAPNLAELPRKEANKRLQDYEKVVFVRDPLDRLLSAYRDKFASNNEEFREWYTARIMQLYRPQLPESDRAKAMVTFEEFLRFVTGPRVPQDSNEHWLQFHKICRPCVVKYDFIGSQDSFGKDLPYVFDHFGLTGTVSYPSRRGYSKVHTHSITEKSYRRIQKALLQKVWEMYADDYKLFHVWKPFYLYRLLK